MDIDQFVAGIPNFLSLQATEQNDLLVYFLTVIEQRPTVKPADIEKLRDSLHLAKYSRTAKYLSERSRKAAGKPARYVPLKDGYVLERSRREEIAAKVGSVALTPQRSTVGEEISQLKALLSFMETPKLRETVEQDLDEVDRCKSAGANKATMTFCGSALEGVLLDVLDRRADIAQSEMKRPADWPDRASLKQMIDIAAKHKLLTETASSVAVAITDYRDLIHPRRSVAANITIDPHTAAAMIHLLKIAIRDLNDAGRAGRIAAFVAS